MSRKPLSEKRLQELTDHLYDSDSNESSIEPFSGSDSDSYFPSESSNEDSSSNDSIELRKTKRGKHPEAQSSEDSPETPNADTPALTVDTPASTADAPALTADALEPVADDIGVWGTIAGNHNVIPSFTESSGVKPLVATLLIGACPGESYEAFIDNSIFSYIADQTNHYASCLFLENDASANSRYHDWVPITMSKIKHFFSLVAWMGIVKIPSLADYWSTHPLLNINFPRSVMSRNRFEILLRTIHFADNNQATVGDKLSKIKPLLDKLLKFFKELVTPDEYICVDETMLPFRGRLSI